MRQTKLFGTWRRTVAYLWIILIFSAVGTYLYFRGANDGVEHYKHSKQFMLTLESQYHFGCMDGLSGQCHSPGEHP